LDIVKNSSIITVFSFWATEACITLNSGEDDKGKGKGKEDDFACPPAIHSTAVSATLLLLLPAASAAAAAHL
jgi:hypothetical protein